MLQEIIVSTGFSVTAVSVIGYFLRDWLAVRLSKGIQHEYDIRFANLESDLRRRESEINSIRDKVLNTAMNGHQCFEERKIKAMDDLWAGFMETQKLCAAVHMLSPFNLDGIAESFDKDSVQQFIAEIIKPLKIDPENMNTGEALRGRSSRPWIPPHIWHVYKAYSSVVMLAVSYLHALNNGVDPRKFIIKSALPDALNKALPDVSMNWDELSHAVWPTLLDLLETKLLVEIQKEVSG
ncbi:MAG: hypothetical protein H6855_06775, partial [Rhodospirillales bacterium]|nr:hypothetical protein [Rhodospirillales bacterium]